MGKSNPGKGSSKRVNRRSELRRTIRKPGVDYLTLFNRPDVVRALLVLLGITLLASSIVIWSRGQLRVRDGQIMTETRLKRLDFQVPDDQATDAKREEARKSSPRVYRVNQSYLSGLEEALLGMPRAVAGKTKLSEISDVLVEQFSLSDEGLAALQRHTTDGDPTPAWKRWVSRLIDGQLAEHPLLGSEEFQLFSLTRNRMVLEEDDSLESPIFGVAIELRASPELRDKLRELVTRAGFTQDVAPYVLARLGFEEERPTLLFDPEKTEELAEAAADVVQTQMIKHEAGEILYRRGDSLSAHQFSDARTELQEYNRTATPAQRWTSRLGIIGLTFVMMAMIGVFVGFRYPRLLRNALRVAGLALLMCTMLVITVTVTVRAPTFLYPAALGPTIFLTVVVLLAYDQRLALIVAAVQCGLCALALEQGVGWIILMLLACGVMIAQLPEVRNRNTLIRAATVTAIVVGLGSVLLGMVDVPLVEGAWRQIFANAGGAAAACFSVGFLVLGILPSIERLLDITTGMTLIELRDPKQPLLRQLQQRAPGTYNHSLQVANICEAAADAIGADGLFVYVGSLYHDIGKLNKPEYFIENQADGYNKHDKLSPAMSLLVIIGHVKDGIELAKEYGLPRPLIHFIESHHGTTLVEYFFHAARTRAESDDKAAVDEVAFRYPGPKPQTREAAILMLSDAVESATRAMPEPNPSRIESLVRSLSRKRLTDGQFDQCPLTFKELGLIEDAIISRLCAIHHGRISYPSSKASEETTTAVARPA